LRLQVEQFDLRCVQRFAQLVFTSATHSVALIFQLHFGAAEKFIQIRHWFPPRALCISLDRQLHRPHDACASRASTGERRPFQT
jgi:hypothetical protein